MDEKLIIQSKRCYVNTLKLITLVLLIIFGVGIILYLVSFTSGMNAVLIISMVCLIIGLIGIVPLIMYFAISKTEINVTDKRVYGKAIFGKRVDLPLDSISAVGTGAMNGIAVATSSGSIRFLAISNNTEIHEEISKLLIERQNKSTSKITTTIKQEIPQSNADELKKYKDLLDSGVITQEEFDAKKKQLLGL